MRKTSILTTVATVGLLVLSGCGGDDAADTGAGGTTTPATESPATESPTGGAEEEYALSTADTDLGTIVVTGEGMTVYVFDRDTPGSGTSACSGDCLVAWPPVTTDTDSPEVEGVTGEVGTITRDDGTMQVTLNGWPLYLWQNDKAPGDTTGQGVNNVWWVVGPDGQKIMTTTAPAS